MADITTAQVAVEVLESDNASALTAQIALEVLEAGATTSDVAQVAIETLQGLIVPFLVAQMAVECLIGVDPCTTPPNGEDLTTCVGPLLFTTWDALGEL